MVNNVRDNETDGDAKILQEVQLLAKAIASSLANQIQIAALTTNSKLPFKALYLREVLHHRVSSLATSAVYHFTENRAIPAVVLTRALVETVALFYVFHERLTRFLEDKNNSDLDRFLMSSLFGSRNQPELPPSTNVLTFVERVEKTIIPGFQSVYDSLSEYAHPNYAGTLGAFSEIDMEQFEVKLGLSKRIPVWTTGINALSGALQIFLHYYDDSDDLVYKLNDYFEQDGR